MLISITITGPVGKSLLLILTAVPINPERPPKIPARTTITESLSVHCLAATAGEIIMALISITPAACIPIITVITIKNDINNPIAFAGNPNVLAKSTSKEDILNSFQNNTITIRRTIPT